MKFTLPIALWVGAAALLAGIGGLMLWRKVYRKSPVFCVYIFSQLVRFAILFSAYVAGDRVVYRQAFLRLELLDAVLSFAVVYELFALTFEAYEGIRELGWMLLRWASIVLVALALIVAFSQSGADKDPFLEGLFAFEMGVSVVKGGLLFLLFVLHAGLGLAWGRHAFGIALGLGLMTSLALAVFALRFHWGVGSNTLLSLVNTVAYDCGLIIWLAALWRADSVRTSPPRPHKWDIEEWNRALLELLHR